MQHTPNSFNFRKTVFFFLILISSFSFIYWKISTLAPSPQMRENTAKLSLKKEEPTSKGEFITALHRDVFSNGSIEEDSQSYPDPVIIEVQVSDQQESRNNEEFKEAKTSETEFSDKPFDSSSLSDSIGVGGLGGAQAPKGNANNLAGNLPKSTVEETNHETYQNYGIHARKETKAHPLSTFGIDVDTASYTLTRRKLNDGTFPPKEAIRVEEFINFFTPEYPKNKKEWFRVHIDATPSPFRPSYHLMRIVIQGKDIAPEDRKPANLVFLVDVSGSMHSENKIGLVKKSLTLLTESLNERDSVAICTYAGAVKTVLEPTSVTDINKLKIIETLHNLTAGGSTAMASGIHNAYSLANVYFEANKINRVIICSDGDANVGAVRHENVLEMIEDYKNKGITLSTVGFGMGNYNDVMMERLADKGDGNCTYVDTLSEAKRVFVEQLTGTLQVIAKDMKVQVEFNPETVKTYRLIGYENRKIKNEDFRKDEIDGGEVGSGHTVTALYEVELQDAQSWLCNVFVRAKQPDGQIAEEIRYSYDRKQIIPSWEQNSKPFRFIVCVAEFAEILRENPSIETSLERIYQDLQNQNLVEEPKEQEFLKLVQKSLEIKGSALFSK